jgi:hypothetical protein
MDRNFWTYRGDLNRFMIRSRRLVGKWEFSARLFSPLCWRCSIRKLLNESPIRVGEQSSRPFYSGDITFRAEYIDTANHALPCDFLKAVRQGVHGYPIIRHDLVFRAFRQ